MAKEDIVCKKYTYDGVCKTFDVQYRPTGKVYKVPSSKYTKDHKPKPTEVPVVLAEKYPNELTESK